MLNRTQLYDTHVAAGATMVDFGGWEMPIQYPTGILDEHLYTRRHCSLFDVSHMGRLQISGPQALDFLQHVLTNNAQALTLGKAQYTIIADQDGYAIDDAYLYRFDDQGYLLVVNAANREKDLAHLLPELAKFNAVLADQTAATASIAVQGPEAKEILMKLSGGAPITEPIKNALNSITLAGIPVRVSKTGYTGEPIGYELFMAGSDAARIWDLLVAEGAKPAGLGARDTLRTEACLPLYGHDLGTDAEGKGIPIYALSVAKFSVSFAEQKGEFIGKAALAKQYAAYRRIMDRDFSDCRALPRRVVPITLTGRGVMRAGFDVYKGDKKVGYVTSGTMIPYYVTQGEGIGTVFTEQTGKRSIGMAYLDSDVLTDDRVEVDIRGKRISAVVAPYHIRQDAPPYARPIHYGVELEQEADSQQAYVKRAVTLIGKAMDNHVWRQEECINLIPSEMTPSRATRMLAASDPAFRYAEHKKVKSFYDHEVFYYQGTKFIDETERLLSHEMAKYMGCNQAETRLLSGQMANTTVFSALMDFKNRTDKKHTPQRLGYVLNNHIIKGGHLSAQPMGALHDYIAIDPKTDASAVVNFPVCADNPYKIDLDETAKVIEEYRPEFIILGKSMVLYPEPVAEIRKLVTDLGVKTTIMYDMAHVLGLIGDHFQKPFAEGADIVTGSTHKTFFGTQRGVIGMNAEPTELRWELWETIQSRAFPGATSNHHLGTQLGLLMSAYEINCFKDAYQKAVIHNARSFAASLAAAGLDVAGDAADGYTHTHQVIVQVGYGKGPEIAERLERSNIICNYQATPDEEGFTASGALRMGVSEMTRFGFGPEAFDTLAHLIADCVKNGVDVSKPVKALRAGYTDMKYCFNDSEVLEALAAFGAKLGM